MIHNNSSKNISQQKGVLITRTETIKSPYRVNIILYNFILYNNSQNPSLIL